MKRTLGLLAALALIAGCGGTATSRDETARLTSDGASTPSAILVAAGDIACPPGTAVTTTSCRQGATARLAASLHPNRVMALGDLQYQVGAYSAFLGSYDKSWGKLKSITWPVVGNHEYLTSGASGYFRYWSGVTSSPGWYRRSINGWQVYVLNGNCDRVSCAAQQTWLRNQMNAHPSKCALIATHQPRYSSGSEHGSSTLMRPFWRIARNHHADIALAGHDHDYERFAPMNADGAGDANGIREFVVGSGGRSLYTKGRTVAGSQLFLRTFGVLKLTLRPSGYSWQFRDTALKVRDSGTSACH
jgi:hypothetical protein